MPPAEDKIPLSTKTITSPRSCSWQRHRDSYRQSPTDLFFLVAANPSAQIIPWNSNAWHDSRDLHSRRDQTVLTFARKSPVSTGTMHANYRPTNYSWFLADLKTSVHTVVEVVVIRPELCSSVTRLASLKKRRRRTKVVKIVRLAGSMKELQEYKGASRKKKGVVREIGRGNEWRCS